VKTPGPKMNHLLESLEPVNSGVCRSGNFHSKNRRRMLGFLENWLTNLAREWSVMNEAEAKMNAIVGFAGDFNQRHLRAVQVYLTCAQFLDSGRVETEAEGYLWFVREYRFEETGGTFCDLWQKFAYRGAEDASVQTPPGTSPVVGFRANATHSSPVVGFRADAFHPVEKEKSTGVSDLMNADVRFPVWFIVAGILVVVAVLYH
jgi:hypothetical protein